MLLPADEAAVAEIVRGAEGPLLVQGNGTKAGMLRPVQAGATLSTARLSGITLYSPNELVMSAKAGTPLSEIEAALAARGQQLIAEPPHFFKGVQTIGGIVASNLSGPRRVSGGAVRDHVLGVRAVNGNGEILKFGGRVLKNVTGLDLGKLLTGSFGTLAILTEITFKVLPVSEATGTILVRGLDAQTAIRVMSEGLGSPFSVSGAAYLPDEKLVALRIEEFGFSVAYRTEKLGAQLRMFGTVDMLDTPQSLALWRDIRDGAMLPTADAVWRVSVTPSAAPGVLRAVVASGVSGFLDWGGGLLHLAGPADLAAHEAVCNATRAAGGVWWLMRAPDPLRAVVDVVPAEPPAPGRHVPPRKKQFRPARNLQSRQTEGRLMQTSFTPEQLADPDIAVANDILRSCVHCGFCTATCPTFVTLGDELDSPRGRIYLIKDMLENNRPAAAQEVLHIDRCLSCLSCMTTCPSGVNYMHLVDHARVHIEKTYKRPVTDRWLRNMLAIILPYPQRMRAAMALARIGRPFGFLLPGQSMFVKRLRAMLNLAPSASVAKQALGGTVHPAIGAQKYRVALLAGCAQQAVGPSINIATIALLNRLGVEVVIPAKAGCCGALVHHMGRHEEALDAARANIAAWTAAPGLDAIIVNTSGCGTVLKDYGFLLRNDSLAGEAAKTSALAVDISEFLTRIGYTPTRPAPGLTVAYHAACSLQHGQQITSLPKNLLRKAGFSVVEPKDAHLCCGSAGTYNIMQPDIAATLRRRKLDTLKAKGPDVIAAGNIGCLTQLAGDGVPTVHTVELLDWMAGGARPAGLPDPAPVTPALKPRPSCPPAGTHGLST